MARIHQPPDALAAPRFTGPRTFARLPHLQTLEDVDCAVFGMPWDGGTTFRSGARFGPEAIRSASGMIRTYNPVQKVQVFGALSAVDHGDAPTAPGYIEETLPRIEQYVKPIAEAGVVPIGMGGDHSVTLAELRALASVHGPLGLVHLDSHTDLWDTYNGLPYSHGTVFRRAIDEGIIEPARVIQAGIRGSLYGEDDERVDRARRADARGVRGARAGPGGNGPGLLHLRRRLRRSRLLPGDRHAGGGRADEPPGDGLPARAARHRVRGLRRGRGRAAVRQRAGDGAVRGQRHLRDALAGCTEPPLRLISFPVG
jgi:hypothetical protein